MKIGFDAKRAFNNFTGLGNYSRFVISALKQYYPENDYFLFTPSAKPHPETKLFKEGFSVIEAPAIYKKTGTKSLWRTYGVSKEIKDYKIGIYHGLSNELPSSLGSCKTVVTIHDLIFMRYPELYKTIDRNIYYYKFKNACLKADRIVAISEQTKQDIQDFFKIPEEKIEVIYQGVHPNFLKKFSDEELTVIRQKYALPEKFLLNVGTVEDRKNALLILKAIQAGKIEIPLVIVGRRTAYVEKLKNYIDSHQMEAQVIFLENVTFSDLPGLYDLSEIFIYPSFFEGFGIPILEALHRDVPVVTSKGSCFHEAGGEVAFYVDPNDEHELAEVLSGILGEKMKLPAQNIVNEHLARFHPETIALDYQNLYNNLV